MSGYVFMSTCAPRDQERVSDSLKLELQALVPPLMAAEDQIWVLGKNIKNS